MYMYIKKEACYVRGSCHQRVVDTATPPSDKKMLLPPIAPIFSLLFAMTLLDAMFTRGRRLPVNACDV